MARGGDASGAMDVTPDVALLAQQRRTRMHADAYVDRAGCELLRHLLRGRERAWGGRKGHKERVALGVDLDPVVSGASLADHPPVLGERIGIRLSAKLVQKPRRPLDVREEERHGAGGEVARHGAFRYSVGSKSRARELMQ